MSILRKPMAVPEGEVAQVAKNASIGTKDDSIGQHKHPLAQGVHDKDGNTHHRSLTPSFVETGTKDLEVVAILVTENCNSSGMCNISSVLSDATDSALSEVRCGGIILEDLEKAKGRVGSVEASFTDTDDCFDLPSFDLGF